MSISSVHQKIFFHVEHNRPIVKICQILLECQTNVLQQLCFLDSSQVGDIAKVYDREY